MNLHHKRYEDDRLFRFHWLTKKADGTPQVDEGHGRDVADAFSRLGYGGGAMRALDYFEEVPAAGATRKR